MVEYAMRSLADDPLRYIGLLTKAEDLIKPDKLHPDGRQFWLVLLHHGTFLISSVDDIKHVLSSLTYSMINYPMRDNHMVYANPTPNKQEEDKVLSFIFERPGLLLVGYIL